MLIDEFFGTIDPITRDGCRTSFCSADRDQEDDRLRHPRYRRGDKYGDHTAILREGSRIAQEDTPERVLTNPADDFVESFIGSGISLKALNLARVSEIQLAGGRGRDQPLGAARGGAERRQEDGAAAGLTANLIHKPTL